MDVYVAVRGYEHEGSEPIGVATTLDAAKAICDEDLAADDLTEDWGEDVILAWTESRLGYSTQTFHSSAYYEIRRHELRDVPAKVGA